MAGRSTIDRFISQRCSRNPARLISYINNMLQFRNDSGFLSNSSGQAGVFTLYMNQGTQRASNYEQGQLIGVGSGVNARAVAATHQSSRPACRRESRPGRERSATLTALNPTSPAPLVIDRIEPPVRAPSVCKSPVQPAALPVTARPAHERP